MNLRQMIDSCASGIHAGGEGSGCQGPNCGRPKGSGSGATNKFDSSKITTDAKHGILNSIGLWESHSKEGQAYTAEREAEGDRISKLQDAWLAIDVWEAPEAEYKGAKKAYEDANNEYKEKYPYVSLEALEQGKLNEATVRKAVMFQLTDKEAEAELPRKQFSALKKMAKSWT